MKKPLCFVLMPFGEKTTPSGQQINFDHIYDELIFPAISAASLEPIRADQELQGGIIHKPMFERLVLCDFAVADLTTANPNVYYELGVRHASRPYSTVPIFAKGERLPFDTQMLRGIQYDLSAPSAAIEPLTNALIDARSQRPDSPVFQLIEDMAPQNIKHEKTDVFRDITEYNTTIKAKLTEARKIGSGAVHEVYKSLPPLADVEAGVAIDILLSFRAVEDWQSMVETVSNMSKALANTIIAREQLAFAYNRLGNRDRAKTILEELIDQYGASSETCGILGRVYKDSYLEALRAGKSSTAKGYLNQAIQTYLQGFENDWRDAYPGINAITMMALANPSDPRIDELLPVVTYAVKRKAQSHKRDYWDCATLIELSVLGRKTEDARAHLEDALALVREPWEPKTTAKNLTLLRDTWMNSGEDIDWLNSIIDDLTPR